MALTKPKTLHWVGRDGRGLNGGTAVMNRDVIDGGVVAWCWCE